MSETSKYRHLTVRYCVGNGLDIGSGGDPVVPWAIQVDLPDADFLTYNQRPRPASVHLACAVDQLPFKDRTLDFVYSSHLLEDFEFGLWRKILSEWVRVLKIGGNLVVIVPDAARWKAACDRGQPPNCAHRHEGTAGKISTILRSGMAETGMATVMDSLTDLTPEDYSLLYVGVKI